MHDINSSYFYNQHGTLRRFWDKRGKRIWGLGLGIWQREFWPRVRAEHAGCTEDRGHTACRERGGEMERAGGVGTGQLRVWELLDGETWADEGKGAIVDRV